MLPVWSMVVTVEPGTAAKFWPEEDVEPAYLSSPSYVAVTEAKAVPGVNSSSVGLHVAVEVSSGLGTSVAVQMGVAVAVSATVIVPLGATPVPCGVTVAVKESALSEP